MKKLFLFLAMASTTMFVSCGSDDSDNNTNPPIEEGATAITLTASASTVQVGTAVVFTVKNNLVPVVDVTASSTFTANNVAFTGGTFTPTEAGTFTIVAKNGTLTSAPFVLTVTAAPLDPQGKYTFGGTDYSIDNMIFQVHGSSAAGIILVNIAGADEPLNVGTLWQGIGYNGTLEDIETAGHYYQYTVFVPATDNGDETYTINFPGEAEASVLSVYAENDLVELNTAAVTTGSATFTSFILAQAEGEVSSSNNAADFTDGTTSVISHEFDGNLENVFYATLTNGARGVNNIKKISSEKVSMAKLKQASKKLKFKK